MTDEMTYEEEVILKWYKTRKALANPSEEAYKEHQAAEELLFQIGMDLNTGTKK